MGKLAWWLEYRPDCEKASRPCEAIMQATAATGVVTWLSCVRKKAGPRNPICQTSARGGDASADGTKRVYAASTFCSALNIHNVEQNVHLEHFDALETPSSRAVTVSLPFLRLRRTTVHGVRRSATMQR